MIRRKTVHVLLISLVLCYSYFFFGKTPQRPNILFFGGREYPIQQVPMLAYWDYGKNSAGTGKIAPPKFDVNRTDNMVGYIAKWEISGSKLFLAEIEGAIDGKTAKSEEILPKFEFPQHADWYTGKIFLGVGDYESSSKKFTAVICFQVAKGNVTKMVFFDELAIPISWNGE
ncbi:MAG: hypothetical protein ABL888_03840 [Pirellulaceae bacterium]